MHYFALSELEAGSLSWVGGRAVRNLPIIALSAKAMPDDQQQCIQAGANDYVAKPLDVDKLISLVRVWLMA